MGIYPRNPSGSQTGLCNGWNYQLNPACGSGSFLFVAFREIKRLERGLLVRLRDAGEKTERLASAVSLTNFHGLDVVPFAVELAKVTLMLAKELELREAAKTEETDGLHLPEKPLPLDNLDQQIVCADALFTPWPKADAIIGNPPYLDARKLTLEHGADYVKKLRAAYPGVPGRADFVVYFFRKAHEHLDIGGRAGLVGANTVRQNESRAASLGYIVENGGVITDAISTQVWSGDAAVHVSIVNWEKAPPPPAAFPGGVESGPASPGIPGGALDPSAVSGDPPETPESAPAPATAFSREVSGEAASTPSFRRVAEKSTRVECSTRTHRLAFQRGDSVDSPWETFEVARINSSLSLGADVVGALVLTANAGAKKCFTGQNPVNAGFFLTPEDAREMIAADPRNREVVWPYMIGLDLVEDYAPTRWIIDFAKRDLFAAKSYVLPFAHAQESVLPGTLAKAEAEKKAQGKEVTRYTRIAERWWQFYDHRPGTVAAIHSVPRWIALSRTSKRAIFEFVSRDIHADSKLMVFAFADDYSFGILQNGLYWTWKVARGSTLKGDQNYTSDTVFDTLPWPQSPTKKQMRAVADAALALRPLRRELMAQPPGYPLRALYRTLDTPGANPLRDAHAALDAAVRAA